MTFFTKLFKGKTAAAQPVETATGSWKSHADGFEKIMYVTLSIGKCAFVALTALGGPSVAACGIVYVLMSLSQGGLRLIADPYKSDAKRSIKAYAQALNPFTHPFGR